MASLFFPQLSTGNLVQFPIRKTTGLRTIRNIMRDGSLVSYPDSGASTRSWILEYRSLSSSEAEALKALFDACVGPFLPFTFLDPTGNLLTQSLDLTNSSWARSSKLNVNPSAPDPNGERGGFTIINGSQSFEEFSQGLAIPANYQYCFSFYVSSPQAASVVLFHRGTNSEAQKAFAVSTNWTRVQSTSRLNDSGSAFTVGFRLAPGQSLTVFGLQLEAQDSCSLYKPTANVGSVYPDCFWAAEELALTAEAPNFFSTVISLQTRL